MNTSSAPRSAATLTSVAVAAKPIFGAEIEHGAPRDAGQHAGCGRRQPAVLDREDVEARAFGDIAVEVEDQRGLGAAVVGVVEAAHQIEPVIVLDRRVDRRRRNAHAVADGHVQPALHLLGVGDRAERNGKGHEAVDRLARVAAERRRGAARAQHLDIGGAVAGQRHAVGRISATPSRSNGMVMRSFSRPPKKRSRCRFEAEEAAVPDMHGVVGGVGMQEAAVQHRDLGLRHRQVLAVDEGDARRDSCAGRRAVAKRRAWKKCRQAGPWHPPLQFRHLTGHGAGVQDAAPDYRCAIAGLSRPRRRGRAGASRASG